MRADAAADPVAQRWRPVRSGIPLAERQVAGDDQAAFFVACHDHLEEQIGLLAIHRQIADFVNDKQAIAVDCSAYDVFQLFCVCAVTSIIKRSAAIVKRVLIPA